MNSEFKLAIELAQETLILGNYDSIILLGAKPQADLRDCSRNISKLLITSGVELDDCLTEMVCKIQKTQDALDFGMKPGKHKSFFKKYTLLFKQLDDVSLYLKIQQAQLIKEIKMFESLKLVIECCEKNIETCLLYANKILCEKEVKKNTYQSVQTFDIGQELDNWYFRLENRIKDLNVSHTVSQQSQAQIIMLIDNNRILINKLSSAISNTIPIWQNQMALLLGVELLEKRLDAQSKVMKIADSYMYKTTKIKSKKKFGKKEEFDFEKMLALNKKIQFVLNEISQIQNEDKGIRNRFQNYLLIER